MKRLSQDEFLSIVKGELGKLRKHEFDHSIIAHAWNGTESNAFLVAAHLHAIRRNRKTFSVELLYSSGSHSYLSVKGKSEWLSKRTAKRQAEDIANMIKKRPQKGNGIGNGFANVVSVSVVDNHGEYFKTYKIETP